MQELHGGLKVGLAWKVVESQSLEACDIWSGNTKVQTEATIALSMWSHCVFHHLGKMERCRSSLLFTGLGTVWSCEPTLWSEHFSCPFFLWQFHTCIYTISVYTPLPFLITTPVLMTPFLASLFTVPKSSICFGGLWTYKSCVHELGWEGIPWSVDNWAVLHQRRKHPCL